MLACLHRMYSEAVKPVYLLSAHRASQGYEKKLGRVGFLESCLYALWTPFPWENLGDPSTFGPLVQVGNDASTELLRDLDLCCQEFEGHKDQTHVCKVKDKRFLRQSRCRVASACFLREKMEERANVGEVLQHRPWGEVMDTVLLNGPALWSRGPPPCTRSTLPTAREGRLSVPEVGEKEREYLF